ncbi:MAG TPA: hypothetical protein VH257_21750, partial [Chloroflexota bacterium]|nr:hypothetical protein [Chloroflexota bacterium]
HLLLRLRARIDGQPHQGQAAEGLPPKWFTKDPQAPFSQEVEDMLRVIRHGATLAVEAGTQPTAFDLWWTIYRAQTPWGAAQRYPPLLSGLGASLVERALIDAACRAAAIPFATAVRDGTLGFRPHLLHPDLAAEPSAAAPPTPPRRIAVRHTVGLSDPLRDEDIPPEERVADGLPQSLAACVRTYGLTHYKIKLSGDAPGDLSRLQGVAAVLAQHGPPDFAFTLDGNEQFHDAGEFRTFWETVTARTELADLLPRLLFVEQPLHRDVALSAATGDGLLSWKGRPPIIIDESDGTVESLPLALERGYAGTSFKCCKGVFRGLANAALLHHRRRIDPHRPAVISGEDLANVGPVALLQDFAVAATLGLTHVERNGHHYFPGLAMLPEEVQRETLRHHGDLYTTAPGGYPTLDVRQGAVSLGSVVEAPFGSHPLVPLDGFTPLDEWRFASLGLEE